MAKSNGIKDLKQAAKLLNKNAPKGESLAYINPEEANVLKARGGSGIMTVAGVPTYGLLDWVTDTALPWVGEKVTGLIGGRYGGDEGLKNLGTDAMSVWVGLKAKKDQEGLNAHEMEQFNKLNQQLADAKVQFDANVGGGPLVTDIPTKVEDVASFTEVDLPTMRTTAVAQGGRIGYQQGTHPLDGVAMEMFGMTFENLNPLQQIVVSQSQSKAYGGRIGYDKGGDFMMASAPDPTAEMNDFSMQVFGKPLHQLTPTQLESLYELMNEQSKAPQQNSGIMQAAIGGRAGYNMGGIGAMKPRMGYQDAGEVVEKTFSEGVYQEFPSDHRGAINVNETQMAVISDMNNKGMDTSLISTISGVDEDTVIRYIGTLNAKAQGGRIGAQKGGIMPLLNMGGMEKDYRQDGGFVPIGRKEKADDVPARLSKNEFVFTADAVRAAGGGDIDQGAHRMYNVMKNLEAGGELSKQSQGQK